MTQRYSMHIGQIGWLRMHCSRVCEFIGQLIGFACWAMGMQVHCFSWPMKLFVDVHGMSLCLRHKSMHICKFLDCCFNIGNVMCLESHSFQNIQTFYWYNPRMHFRPDHMWSACDSFTYRFCFVFCYWFFCCCCIIKCFI